MAEKTSDHNYFENHERQRDAELITPPHEIKKKVGSGGIDIELVKRAEALINNNKTDFVPIAESYFELLEDNTRKALQQELKEDEAFEALLYPLVQLKAQGAMFKHPFITNITGVLINFLEIVKTLDKEVFEIITAHNMALSAILTRHTQKNSSAEAQVLTQALEDACKRYIKTHNI